MDISLDDYIRGNKNGGTSGGTSGYASGGTSGGMDISLDEYIFKNKMGKPQQNRNQQTNVDSGVSKFDRYKHQDDEYDDLDDDGTPKRMPKLVPFVPKTMPQKSKPAIHQRLGQKRDSVCESIHTSQMKLFRPTKFKAKASVQSRLGKNYVNPAVKERSRIALHAVNEYARSVENRLTANDDVQGQQLLNALTRAIKSSGPVQEERKYDMNIQREISSLQGKELYYTCPGGFVISSDGPGLNGVPKVPNHQTSMSMNQRFA